MYVSFLSDFGVIQHLLYFHFQVLLNTRKLGFVWLFEFIIKYVKGISKEEKNKVLIARHFQWLRILGAT